MSFGYILRRVAASQGMTNYETNEAQRNLLGDVINEAARQVYKAPDIPISLQECCVRVTPNREMCLPPFVGEIRAIRDKCWEGIWTLHDVRPRYHYQDWPKKWKTWRVKGYSPLAVELLNSAPGTIIIPAADNTLQIAIVGQTETSNRKIDTVTMDSESKTWTSSFDHVTRIAKSKITDYDVTIQDADGNEIAIIYADQFEARYMIVDVSEFPTNFCCCSECPDGTFIMEVLYKPRLNEMLEDDDSFPVDGYDDVIILKAKQLFAEDKPGQEQRAILMHEKGKELVEQITEDKVGTVQKQIKFMPNQMFGLYDRYSTHNWRNR